MRDTETTDAEIIYTKGLIKATGARVIWGNNRYVLHRSYTNALEWRARDEADTFFWCTITTRQQYSVREVYAAYDEEIRHVRCSCVR